jgi:hypothetical protein
VVCCFNDFASSTDEIRFSHFKLSSFRFLLCQKKMTIPASSPQSHEIECKQALKKLKTDICSICFLNTLALLCFINKLWCS